MEVPFIFLNKLLSETAKRGANSLHLSVGSLPIMRVDGELENVEENGILSLEILQKILDSFLEKEEKERLKKQKELVVVKTFAGGFRFRVNIFFQKNMPSVSFSFINDKIFNWDELELTDKFKELIQKKSGLIIFAGSNDSGKTGTIASMIENINNNYKKYIITLEKPIEYMFVNKKSIIEQREIGRDVISLSDGLKHCLDEDVDIVYVNEIDDEFEEGIPLIVELAQGNSLVILELNAEDSVRAIDKILTFLKNKMSEIAALYNISDVLLAIVSQKLIPRIGGGMVMAPEIMISNSAVKSLIRDKRTHQIEGIIETSRQEGMVSVNKSIEELVKKGIVSRKIFDNYKKMK
jgi:twitching motility protein PilT